MAIAIGTAYAISVAAPPRNSHDLWSYVMYGRMVSAHHLSPYSHVPIDFLHDPLLGRVATGWRHTSSVYGPLFTGVSAALTRVAVAVYEFELPAHPSLAGAWAVVRSVLVQAGAWLALGRFIAPLVSQRTRDRAAPTTPTAMPMAAPPSPRSCC